MSNYRYYKEARDTAWRALLRLPKKQLPVDVEALAHCVGMDVLPFPDEAENPRLAAALARSGDASAVSLRIKGDWHIFLRENKLNEAEKRFAVAHELGHLLLGHETRSLSPGVRAFASLENQGDLIDDPQDLDDYAADIFAIRLLAPAFLLHELRVDTADGIMRLCGMPPRAAAMRADRMDVLNERDAFLSHPLERQLRDAFQPYLRAQLEGAADAHQAAEETPKRSIPLVLPEKKLHSGTAEAPPMKTPGRGKPAPRSKIRGWALAAGALAAIAAFFLLRALL